MLKNAQVKLTEEYGKRFRISECSCLRKFICRPTTCRSAQTHIISDLSRVGGNK